MKVSEVMSRDVRTAASDSTLETIAKIRKDEDVGAVPVWDKQELIGIITDRDIVICCVAQGKDPAELTADEIIEGEVKTIDSEAEVEEGQGVQPPLGKRESAISV